MIGSLYSGSSGVKTYSNEMTVVGSNIANVNTVGYKQNRVNFEDLLSTSVAGGSKIGKGVNIKNIQTLHNQGAFEITDQETDLSIDGDGFFTVKDKAGNTFYTRAGQFTYDKQGFLVNQEGMFLQVKDISQETNNTFGSLKKLNVLDQIDPPTPTGDGTVEGTGVNLAANLDSKTLPPITEVDYDNVSEDMYNYSTSVTVFDNKGSEHSLNVVFRKLPDQPARINPATGQPVAGTEVKNQWQWMVLTPGEELENGFGGVMKAVGGGFIRFSNDGRMVSDQLGVITPPVQAAPGQPPRPARMIMQNKPDGMRSSQIGIEFKGAGEVQNIGFFFGKGSNPNDPRDARTGVDGLTQFANDFRLITATADGMKSGKLESIVVREDGTVDGSFDSGKTKALGRVSLAKFKANENLAIRGKNLFAKTFESGNPIDGDPNNNGMGSVRSKSLERSNVELSNEFVRMIEGQRAFQANAKTITTSDEIIADMIQMKR
ncbi:MAG: flagellar hook protein FlgE [Deltaproteobacteria bacterium]|nr:flagellar hook protein FlgE [Deltaproteobacteria bacterium]